MRPSRFARPTRDGTGETNLVMGEPAKPTRYEIRVRGVLSETLLQAFPGLDAKVQESETVLSGTLRDQAALYGVLAQIESLGLELLEVRRTIS
jgi:transposase-like protein